MSDWFSRFKEYACFFCFCRTDDKIGGYGEYVEIDEALLVKRKYNRGRVLRNQKWVFGGVILGRSNECFIEYVENRSRAELIEVISRWIAPGTTIVSDCWRAYADLPSLLPDYNFQHKTVNHSHDFVNPNDPAVHTQTIEAFWSVIKRKLRKRGTNHGSGIGYLIGELLYRRKFGINDDEFFNSFIRDINEWI